jgi:hypothetical protein
MIGKSTIGKRTLNKMALHMSYPKDDRESGVLECMELQDAVKMHGMCIDCVRHHRHGVPIPDELQAVVNTKLRK